MILWHRKYGMKSQEGSRELIKLRAKNYKLLKLLVCARKKIKEYEDKIKMYENYETKDIKPEKPEKDLEKAIANQNRDIADLKARVASLEGSLRKVRRKANRR